jgi:acyl carrier protein
MTGRLARPREHRDMDDIEQAIKDYIVDHFLEGRGAERLSETTPLVTGGILDSLASLNLIGFLEKRYGIEFAAHEASVDNLDTIASLAALVRVKRAS